MSIVNEMSNSRAPAGRNVYRYIENKLSWLMSKESAKREDKRASVPPLIPPQAG